MSKLPGSYGQRPGQPIVAQQESDWARRKIQQLSQPLTSVSDKLPIYATNALAIAGKLQPGDLYRTAAGALMVRY